MEYCIVINNESKKIEMLKKCVTGQVLGINDPAMYTHTIGDESTIATFALDGGCDMTEFQTKLDEANEPDSLGN